MKIYEDFYFLKVEKRGFVDSSSLLVIRDSKGLICVETGGGGEKNIRQTTDLFEADGLNIRDVHTVIISHTHADHMGAIAHFRVMCPALTVVDHELDAPYLQDNTLLNRIFDADLVATHFPGNKLDILDFYASFCPISESSPDRTVQEGDQISCGAYTFEVIHTPGHHIGHISLFERNLGLLFVGDMLGMEVPFYTPSSGGAAGYLLSMRKYQSLDVTRIVPSHGDLIETPREAVQGAVGKLKRREERILEALKISPMTFNELLPELFRNPDQHMFPGAAILASHLDKLKTDELITHDNEHFLLP